MTGGGAPCAAVAVAASESVSATDDRRIRQGDIPTSHIPCHRVEVRVRLPFRACKLLTVTPPDALASFAAPEHPVRPSQARILPLRTGKFAIYAKHGMG